MTHLTIQFSMLTHHPISHPAKCKAWCLQMFIEPYSEVCVDMYGKTYFIINKGIKPYEKSVLTLLL